MDTATAAAWLGMGLAQCRMVVSEDGGLLLSLFLAGFAGSLAHCAGMCGPFVLAQVAVRLEAIPLSALCEWRRLTSAAVLPYHCGRASTYAVLGGVCALAGGSLAGLADWRWGGAGLLLAAAALFLAQAVQRLRRGLRPETERSCPAAANRSSPLSLPLSFGSSAARGAFIRRLLARPQGWRGYMLGVMLGFLPCGLVYGALAVAAASGHPLSGVLGMLAFAVGTVPALLLVGVAGHVAGQAGGRILLARVAPVLMIANAGVLGVMAWRMVA